MMKSNPSVIRVGMLAGTLVLVALGLWTAVRFPTVDALWRPDGTVEWVLPDSPAAAALTIADRVLTVDGLPVARTGQILGTRQPGDSVVLGVERQGQPRQVTVIVRPKSLTQFLLQSSRSLALALAFWAIGAALVLQSLKRARPADAGAVAGLFFTATGAQLALGGVSQYAPDGLLRVYATGLWFLGPLGLWLHLIFPRPYRFAHSRGWLLALFGVAAGGAFWGLWAEPDYLGAVNAAGLTAAYAWLMMNTLAALALLVGNGWRHPSPAERRQLGVVALGGTLALAPLLTAILVPRLLGIAFASDQGLVMVPLVLLPASYGYAIHRYQRLAQDRDRRLLRGLRYLFSAMAVSLVILVGLSLPIVRALPDPGRTWTAILGGGLAAPVVMGLVETLWDLALFGRRRQPLRRAAEATTAIDLGIDAEDLSAQVDAILRDQIGVEESAILVLDDARGLVDVSPGRASAAAGIALPPSLDLAAVFSGKAPVLEFEAVRDRLLASPARALLDVPWAQAVLPLRTQQDLVGLLLIGYRAEKPFLDEDDILVLGMVATALATALKRRALVAHLRRATENASQLSRELLRVREDERKRIARDLHDEIIQNLIVVSYGLASVEDPPGLRDQVLGVIERARTLCFELRQYQLDNLGIAEVVRHAAASFERRSGLPVVTEIEVDPDVVVPEPLATALLGIQEEALANAHRHAGASQITIRVCVTPERLRLRIADNGIGFTPTEPGPMDPGLRHFGLALMRERAALVDGALAIQSAPGAGTRILFEAALAPLTPGATAPPGRSQRQ